MSKNKNNKPIWGTRIKKNVSTLFKKVGGSLSVDKRLFKEDIEGSVAHVEMLHKQKIINFRIKNKIIWGLKRIKNEIVKKKFNFDYDLEDIHMNIENRLFELIGDDAGYVHTARSRNDQVITDLKLWLKEATKKMIILLDNTNSNILNLAQKNIRTIMPDEKVFAIKPMNCPGCVQVFNQGLKSYRDLPLKMSEFGKVHRYEPSGALHGLLRVRAFTQDDAHIFCTEEQITEECLSVTNLILEIYKDLGFEDVILKYSDRPDLRVGDDKVWDKSEAALLEAIKATKLEYSINKGEGAFYGPKIEFVLRDAIGRDWQCGTLQVDLNLPGRLGASFVDKDGTKKVPVMLHRALFGSLERFIGILIENYAGKLPFWISPLQAVVIPISSDFDEYAKSVAKELKRVGLIVEVDLKNHNLNYKIRDHSLTKVPMLLICGKKEVDSNSVTIRRLDSNKQENMALKEFIKKYSDLNKAPSI